MLSRWSRRGEREKARRIEGDVVLSVTSRGQAVGLSGLAAMNENEPGSAKLEWEWFLFSRLCLINIYIPAVYSSVCFLTFYYFFILSRGEASANVGGDGARGEIGSSR